VFQPGDSILFKRGDVWNESLAPASSGSSGNPITFDAYGTGAAPNLTGYYSVPTTAWVLVTGNAWKAPVPATYTTINFCLFGSVWGQKVAAASSNLTAQWDFYLANGFVYVYSQGNPAAYYNEPIVPMALSNVPVININGQSWLTFQHFLVNWFDQYGVSVQGTSDHLVFANMEADSMIPQGTQPLGFYVDESAPGPGDLKIYNSEAHLNYDGFRFDGAATAITMVNDKGYANRDGALVDNTGAVTYSYCHFYASSLAVAGSTDVEWTSGNGPTAGAGNIAADTAPAVEVYQRYPAHVTLTVDDAGMTPGADTYYADTVLPVADAAGVPVGAAITVGYPLAQTLIAEFQGWVNAGRDVTAHSMSHTYYTNTDALDIQYTGSGTAATLSISNKTLTIAVTGASDGVSYNLTQGQPQGTMLGLAQALAATGKFTTSYLTPCQGPYGTGCSAYTAAALLAQDLADVSGQDVRTAVYHMQLDVNRLTTDEITLSRQWMTTNLTGLPATPVYVYPGGYETPVMQGITAGVPYTGARGALKEDFGVKDTYADGFNLQNITSFGVNPSWMGLEPAVLNQKIQALVWKESVWGVPWGIFWHLNELTNDDPVGGTEITNLIQDFKNNGATILTNTGLVNWLLSGTQESGTDGNYYYKSAATSMVLNFRPTEDSPVVDAGQNLGTAYELDINGVNQNSYGSGWEIGAHVYEGYAMYGGGAGSGQFVVGSELAPIAPQLPLTWVDNNEATDGLVYTPPQYELNLQTQTWVTGPPAGCTFHLPYWTVGSPTFGASYSSTNQCSGATTGLQGAVCDVEACRTASGGTEGFILDVPPAMYGGPEYGLVLPQSSSTAASSFIILRSTDDASLPNGQTVGSHGIQDNCFSTATDIGLNNPDLTGQNMYYTCGPSMVISATSGQYNGSMAGTTATFTLVSGTQPANYTVGNIVKGYSFTPQQYDTNWIILSAGSSTFTAEAYGCLAPGNTCISGLANTTATGAFFADNIISGQITLSTNTTTLIPVSAAASNILVPLANGYVSPGNAYVIDTGANQETVIAAAGPNQRGIWGTFTKAHAAGAPVTFCASGCSYTLANSTIINTSSYNDLQYMWQVEGAGGSDPGGLTFCNPGAEAVNPACGSSSLAPDHWLIEDFAASFPAGSAAESAIIEFGPEGNPTATSQLASHVHLRKFWAHGDWTSLHTGANSISNGVHMQCIYCSALDGNISQVLRPSAEGHGFGYGYGSQMKVNHNWIDGGSSASLCGGFGASVSIPGVIACQDMEWRRNRATFPYAWLGLGAFNFGYYSNPTWDQFTTYRKNLWELKEGERWVRSGNIMENVDNSGGQGGKDTLTRVTNCSSCASDTGGNNYFSINTNGYDAGEIFRNTCTGPGFQGRSNFLSDGQGAAYGVNNMLFSHELVYNASYDNNPGCHDAALVGWDFSSGLVEWSGTIVGNGTTATFTAACSPQVNGNCPSGPLPAGSQQSSINVGDIVAITGCTLFSGFNNGTVTYGHTWLALGPPALTGTNPTSNPPVVVFASAVTGTDNSGNCTLSYMQGWPNNLQVDHVTSVIGDNYAIGSSDDLTAGPPYTRNLLLRDSLFVGALGWGNSSVGHGTNWENFCCDVTSMSNDHTVWPGQTAASYTEFGNNPNFPDAAGCTGAGCSPPSTMYFPANSCVGWVGACSGSVPLTYPDYHSFALSSSSSFYAGNAEDASDGTSMGANIGTIDAEQTLNTFVCPYSCGSPGPYPDSLAAPAVAASFWGFSESDTNGGSWPTVSYGMQRFWDSPPLQWPYLNTASGVFDFTSLDSDLALAFSNGAMEGMYTLARTPPWATSNPTDASCNYTGSGAGLGDGECDPPSDLNSDGSGADAIWKAWITAIATHVNSPGYTATHAHIKYWEIWNEPDTQAFWNGSIAALARLTEDANCIITGRGVIHENGNGTATPCTATAIDPTAQIVMASAHAKGPALIYGQNELYCNNTSGIPAYELPCPNPPNAIAAAVDIINFHMKAGSETGNNCPAPTACTAESAMQWYISNIHSILQPTELAKLLWDGEAQYSTTGFNNAYSDPDMAASFMPRFYLMDWTLGLNGMAWYYANSQAEPVSAETSYQQTYNWLVNASLVAPCAASGTVWSCTIQNGGTQYLILWDTSQSCSSGSCTTGNQTVASRWTQYQDMTTASTPIAISGHSVPVGIKPVVIH
jgi:hypothetical protein